jgi:hypothetical protein
MHAKSKNRNDVRRRGCQYNAHLEGIALAFLVFTGMLLLPVFNLEKRKNTFATHLKLGSLK